MQFLLPTGHYSSSLVVSTLTTFYAHFRQPTWLVSMYQLPYACSTDTHTRTKSGVVHH